MSFLLSKLRNIVQNWPGRKTFGHYSFLPVFFGLGAGLEFTMINWTPNGTNFCENYYYFECNWEYQLISILTHLPIADNTYKKSLASSLVDRKEYIARQEAKNKHDHQ